MDASILHGACGGYMARLSRHRDRASAGLIPCLADPALDRDLAPATPLSAIQKSVFGRFGRKCP